jgi:hypothetical protein
MISVGGFIAGYYGALNIRDSGNFMECTIAVTALTGSPNYPA